MKHTPKNNLTHTVSYKQDGYVQANAHLIASAPKLLEACKLALKYLYKMEADGIETALPVKTAIQRIEQAISKAEGKEEIT